MDDKEEIEIPSANEKKYFVNREKIHSGNPNTLYIPLEPNKTSVDCVMPLWLFQITINKKHKPLPLHEVIDQFKPKKPQKQKWKLCIIMLNKKKDFLY